MHPVDDPVPLLSGPPEHVISCVHVELACCTSPVRSVPSRALVPHATTPNTRTNPHPKNRRMDMCPSSPFALRPLPHSANCGRSLHRFEVEHGNIFANLSRRRRGTGSRNLHSVDTDGEGPRARLACLRHEGSEPGQRTLRCYPQEARVHPRSDRCAAVPCGPTAASATR
jgi:hypothetical protein